MEILVTYDVATDTVAGRRRLRRVAKICEAHGQRVQQSVFECILTEMQLEILLHRLQRTIVEDDDSLRIYRLREPRDRFLRTIGRRPVHDLHGPLLV